MIRAGLYEETISPTIVVNDFGVAAIGGLVGLMITPLIKKLRDLFDVLLGIKKDGDTGDTPPPETPPEKTAAIRNNSSATKIYGQEVG